LFPDRDPLGAVIDTTSGRRLTVVAVVADVVARLDRPTPPMVYVSPTPDTAPLQIAARLRRPREPALAEVKRTLARVAPHAPVTLTWWQDAIADVAAYRNPRFQTLVLGSFGLIAIALTAVGVFAIVAFTVTARQRELGIRLALGSAPAAVIALVMRHVLLPITGGLLLGVVVVRALTPLSDAQLGEASGGQLAPLAGAVVVVIAAGVISAFVPARRAANIDPIESLREL
jgi:putative ABC transport system permease protein